jgi:hypothetical protein
MKYTTVEVFIAIFSHAVLPSVPGETNYHTLRTIRQMLRENACSIDTHLGGDLGILASSYQILPMKESRL